MRDSETPEDRRQQELWRGGAFYMQKCDVCAAFVHPPAPLCPVCLSFDLEWTRAPTGGAVLASTTFHRAYFHEMSPPYSCLCVELDAGPLFITNPADCLNGAIQIGARIDLRIKHFENISLPIAHSEDCISCLG
jgi:uncharacterized protein